MDLDPASVPAAAGLGSVANSIPDTVDEEEELPAPPAANEEELVDKEQPSDNKEEPGDKAPGSNDEEQEDKDEDFLPGGECIDGSERDSKDEDLQNRRRGKFFLPNGARTRVLSSPCM